ncbi:phage holin family protein [Apibacter raozihei]|uniref:phage holin family protein n=1 Tax=Apibacter TaxID=1778601 RepID=UPI000FE3B0DA|nr:MULTISPECIES: phage holin family protein [Apibacter]
MVGIIKKYVNKRIELLKIELTETISSMISILIYIFIVLTLAMMFLILFSLAIGFLIGALLNNWGLGILIFSLVYLLAFIILIFNYNKIRKYIMHKIIEIQLNAKDEEEDDQD